jgi:hypothetical protein
MLLWRNCRSAAREGSGIWTSNKAQNNQTRTTLAEIGARAISPATNRFLFIDIFLFLNSGLAGEFVKQARWCAYWRQKTPIPKANNHGQTM